MSENITTLKEWHTLYEQGIITEKEFVDKKRELLGLRAASSQTNNLSQIDTTNKTNQVESLEGASERNIKTATASVRKIRTSQITKDSSMSANTMFFIILGLLGVAIFGFWFWNKSKTDNADFANSNLNILEMRDSAEIDTEKENLMIAVDSAVYAAIEKNDKKAKNEEPNKNEDIEFDRFFVQFKEAVATKNKKRALELTDVNEFSAGGGLETASEWFDGTFKNPDDYSDFLETLRKGVEKETHKFPDGEKYKLIFNEDEVAEGGGGHFFTIKDGKWTFGGYMH